MKGLSLHIKKYLVSERNGQALIESLIAVTVLVVGFLGIFNLLSQSLGLYRVTTENYAATYLAAEGIELAKNVIDSASIQNKEWTSVLPGGKYAMDLRTDVGPNQPKLCDSSPVSPCNKELYFDPQSLTYSYDDTNGSPTSFKREISVQYLPTDAAHPEDQVKVSSVVSWIGRGGGEFNVELEDHFYRWR
ncbi:MAG: hypothetical protein V1489_01570 [Candidatus Liptonbacteria bacterium]